MSDTLADLNNASGFFKKRYGKLKDLRSKNAILQKLIPFQNSERTGESYSIAVALEPPNGFTYTGATATVSTLNDAVSSVTKQALSSSYECILREQVLYKTFSQAVRQGEAAFGNAFDLIMTGMQNSISNRLEMQLLHGQRGFGSLSGVVVDNTTYCTAPITSAEFSQGLWYALIGGYVDAMTSTTVNNSNTTLRVKNVDVSAKTVDLTYTTGTIANEITTSDVLFPKGSYGSTPTEMLGLLAQGASTSGSTTFGLAVSTYPNWGSNQRAISGALDFRTFQDCMHQVRARGMQSSENARYIALVGRAYAQLVADFDGLRAADQSYSSSKAKVGVEGMDIFSPEIGNVSLVFHPFMKDGEVLIFDPEDCVRSGASEITFSLPGKGEGMSEFFQYVATKNAVEFQALFDQFIMHTKPGNMMLLTGITT